MPAAVAERLVGRDVDHLCAEIGAVARDLLWDSQLRWLGPDKGVMHMAIGAVINATWDLRARVEDRPLWQSLLALTPAEVVDLIDWTYLTDALDPGRARELLEERTTTRPQRLADVEESGLAAYTTGPGWLGYDDHKLARLCRRAVAEARVSLSPETLATLREGAPKGDVIAVARIAGIQGAMAVLVAIREIEQKGGTGQTIDLSLLEPIFSIMYSSMRKSTGSGIPRSVQGRTARHPRRDSAEHPPAWRTQSTKSCPELW